jgi:hypothetical protein
MRYLIAFLLGVAVGLALTVTMDSVKQFTFPPVEATPSRNDRSGDPMLHYPARTLLAAPVMPAFFKPERPKVRYLRRLPKIIRPSEENLLTARQGYGRRIALDATPTTELEIPR